MELLRHHSRIRIIQCNLNRSWRAQDLLEHHVRELSADLCIVSEPARAPASPLWHVSSDGLSAIGLPSSGSLSGCLWRRDRRFVSVRVEDAVVIACYCSPNVGLVEFRALLDELETVVRPAPKNSYLGRPTQVILGGDFNAKSPYWDSSHTNRRGEILVEWAGQWRMYLTNRGEVPTCVRSQDSSIIDLTWMSPWLERRVLEWTVMTEVESLSDHLYIFVELGSDSVTLKQKHDRISKCRWVYRSLSVDAFRASLEWSCSSLSP